MTSDNTSVPLATEPGISLIILPLMRILQRNLKRTTDTFLFISHTTNALLFKFRCNVFIGVRIIKEMVGSVASGTHCISLFLQINSALTVQLQSLLADLNIQPVSGLYSKTCLKRNAIVPVFFLRFHRFPFYKGLCFNKTNYVQKIWSLRITMKE